MFFSYKNSLAILLSWVALHEIIVAQTAFEQNIVFYTTTATGETFNSTFTDDETLTMNCPTSENYTVIVHGWGESISSSWVKNMIGNFTEARGGCVIFMDYYFYSKQDYGTLTKNFNSILTVLVKKLVQFNKLCYSPKNAWMFGFSYGAQLTFAAAYQYYNLTGHKIARVDCCDPAGPSFNYGSVSTVVAAVCAETVQCIHTSCGYGTCDRYCQFHVNMGQCGSYQEGESSPPLKSHGMCPHLYNNAFTLDFRFVKKPSKCENKVLGYLTSEALTNSTGEVMGFRLDTSLRQGYYYAPTCRAYPWNWPWTGTVATTCSHVT